MTQWFTGHSPALLRLKIQAAFICTCISSLTEQP